MNYKNVFREAVRTYWGIQSAQAQKQIEAGVQDTGRRGEVTGGGHLDGFLVTIENLLTVAGVDPATIYTHKLLSVLPGFFRPTKMWDLLVVDDDGRVRIVIELKSIGSSFGNNANNRAEEAIGNAHDLWTAYREEALGRFPKPWVGYLFVLPVNSKSTKPVNVEEPHHRADTVYRGEGRLVVRKSSSIEKRRTVIGVSYQQRFEILCRRLVHEGLYSEACLLLSDVDRVDDVKNYNSPAGDIGDERFVEQLIHAGLAP